LNKATEDRALVLSLPNERRFAAADETQDEENRFLDDLRKKARDADATIVNWVSTRTQYAPDNTSGLAGITRVSCDLNVVGPYQDLRKLVGELTNSDRLFTISNVTWHRIDPAPGSTAYQNQLSFSLVRYVAPPTGVSPTSSSPTAQAPIRAPQT
jgi:hypothetical protein